MTNSNTKTFNSTFEKEVNEGLVAFPKYLSSKWFYDKKGDKLFQNYMMFILQVIMEMMR